MKLRLLIFLFLCSSSVFSQRQAANWFFGGRAGIHFNADNTITVLSVAPNPIGINTSEGCSSLSDADGNLLLYTDGRTVWDRNHVIMPNGNYTAGTGLMGDPSSTQSGIIVPKPNDSNIFYIFTVDEPHHQNALVYPAQFTGVYSEGGLEDTVPFADDGLNNGLNYSIVDMSLTGSNGSVGDVTVRNTHLVTYNTDPAGQEIRYKCSEKITAVKTKNNDGYWLITQFTDKFYAFKITESGVSTTPVISQVAPLIPLSGYRRNAIGYLKASPNGMRLAVAHSQMGPITGGSTEDGQLYVYDFNNETGVVSNAIKVWEAAGFYGVEFSAQSKKLYATNRDGVWQFNLESADIPGSGVTLSSRGSSALQLGPDSKIYKANISDVGYLDVINNPELDGIACNFQERGVFLEMGSSRFGLPPFITSVFSSNIQEKNTCLGDTTTFEAITNEPIDSAVWDFGDGSVNSNSITPGHTYATPGDYNVHVTVVIQGEPVSSSKVITIHPLPAAFPAALEQCSMTNSAIGIPFNLSQANADLTDGNTALVASFFVSAAAANDASNALPGTYSNTSNPQTLYVRVTDPQTNCYTLTTLELTVRVAVSIPLELSNCDDDGNEDGFFAFNLDDADIAAGFPATAAVTYYSALDDAFLEQNPISPAYTNTAAYNQTVYARVENNNDCLSIFAIKLSVLRLPQIEITDTDYVCNNLPNQLTTLDAGLLQGNPSQFTYLWSTGATTQTIQVNTPGNYTVTVTNASLCQKSRTITVLPSNDATIEDIVIVDLVQNNTVTVLLTASSIGDYQYSIDMPNGPFQSSNHFEHVAPGIHTVYVYDAHGCGIVSQDISILSIPAFFTPNGDGFNDTWNIIGINARFYADADIYIFDRYGKLLAGIDPLGYGWNGIYNGAAMPSTDYWYLVHLSNGRTVRGHFSLKR